MANRLGGVLPPPTGFDSACSTRERLLLPGGKIQYTGPVEPAQTYKRIAKTRVICIPVRYIHTGTQVSGGSPEGVY